MRRAELLVAVVLALIVAALSGSAVSHASTSMGHTVKIPLPPPNQVKVVVLTVKSAGPFKVSAANAAQLGSPALNTQAISAVKAAGKGVYKVIVVIHRFPPARRLAHRTGGAVIALPVITIVLLPTNPSGPDPDEVSSQAEDCEYLHFAGFYGDNWDGDWTLITDLVPIQASPSEGQVDVAVHTKCPQAEAPDSGDG